MSLLNSDVICSVLLPFWVTSMYRSVCKGAGFVSVSFSFFIFISRAKAFMLDTQVCLLLGKNVNKRYLLLKVALEIFCIFWFFSLSFFIPLSLLYSWIRRIAGNAACSLCTASRWNREIHGLKSSRFFMAVINHPQAHTGCRICIQTQAYESTSVIANLISFRRAGCMRKWTAPLLP